MRVLYITSKPVYPSVDGGTLASQRFLESLDAAEIAIKHFSIGTEKHPFDASKYPESIRNRFSVEGLNIKTAVNPLKAFFALFKKGSYNVKRFYSKDVETKLIEIIQNDSFDAIIFDSLFTSPYLEAIKSNWSGKTILRAHNVESDIWRAYGISTNGLKGKYIRRLAKDLCIYERSITEHFDVILTISQADTERFAVLGISTPCVHIPVSINVTENQMDYSANSPYHLGSMEWEPNIEAVNKLIELFPKIREKAEDSTLFIAGNKAKETVKANGVVKVDGFVECPTTYGKSKGILLSPIQSGSGIRIKILEAMAMGVPVLTTTIGALGIDHQTTHCLEIADTDEEFVQKAQTLINTQSVREEIGRNASEYIRKNHNIEAISQRLVEVIESK